MCGSQLTTPTGEITSPNYPNSYPHGRLCNWTVFGENDQQILVNVTDIQMEVDTTCSYDALEIRLILIQRAVT